MAKAGDWDWYSLRSRCHREALRLVRCHYDAEEVVQETLSRAWRSRASCRSPEAPLAWMLEITRNEAFRLLGRRRPSLSAEPQEVDSDLHDPQAELEIQQMLERVDFEHILEELSPADRLLLGLRYEQDRAHSEIAAALQISETAARIRLHRLHKRVRELL